jgi:hypothetical protein
MPVSQFINIYIKFETRTNNLMTEFEDKTGLLRDYGNTFETIHNDARSFLIIRLQMLWGQLCRELIIRSALGGYHTISGTILRKGSVVTDWRSIQTIIQRRKGKGHSPWHIANFSMGVASDLRIQNYTQVSMSLGGTSPMDIIMVIRNYLVHPDELTKTKYENTTRAMGITGKIDPIDLMKTRVTGGAILLEDWVADLQLIAFNAMQ